MQLLFFLMSNFKKVKEFHSKFGLTTASKPGLPTAKDAKLRRELMFEEYHEAIDAIYENNLEHIAKELADLLYVVYGTAATYGIPIDEVFAEVHRSNMTKVFPDGTVKRRADGKIEKPETYSPANVKDILIKEL